MKDIIRGKARDWWRGRGRTVAAATSEAEGRTHIKIIAIFVQVMGGNFSIGHLRSQWRKREKWRRERGTKVTRVPRELQFLHQNKSYPKAEFRCSRRLVVFAIFEQNHQFVIRISSDYHHIFLILILSRKYPIFISLSQVCQNIVN